MKNLANRFLPIEILKVAVNYIEQNYPDVIMKNSQIDHLGGQIYVLKFISENNDTYYFELSYELIEHNITGQVFIDKFIILES